MKVKTATLAPEPYLPNLISFTETTVILSIIGTVKADAANYKACEFYGSTIENMSIDSRLCISNQAMEMGAKAAIIPPDMAVLPPATDPFSIIKTVALLSKASIAAAAPAPP